MSSRLSIEADKVFKYETCYLKMLYIHEKKPHDTKRMAKVNERQTKRKDEEEEFLLIPLYQINIYADILTT